MDIDGTLPIEEDDIIRSSIWYRDGSIVLQAEQTQFCVHQSVLSQHSTVFRNMLENSPNTGDATETIDGLPLVHLAGDFAYDIECLLTALYDSSIIDAATLSEETFPMLSAVLRLSTKYLIRKLRVVAEKQFLADVPSAVYRPVDASEIHQILESVTALASDHRLPELDLDERDIANIGDIDESMWKLDLADLFAETQLRRGLPLAIYYWTLLDPFDIYRFDLNEVDKQRVFKHLRILSRVSSQMFRLCRSVGTNENITMSLYGCMNVECVGAIQRHFDAKAVNGLFTGKDHCLMGSWKCATVNAELCARCNELMVAVWRRTRLYCLTLLPLCLELGTWRQLEEEDAAFLETFD